MSRMPADSGAARPRARAVGEGFVGSPLYPVLSRSGFVARALVYGIIGLLAFDLAIGRGGKITNQQGALRTVAQHSFGHALLAALAVGLGGYAVWRLFRAALGHGREGSDQGIERVGAFGSGVVYALLCVFAVQILVGSGELVRQGRQEDHGRRVRLAGRPLADRHRRARAARRRGLPVHPRSQEEVSQGREDRGDPALDRAGVLAPRQRSATSPARSSSASSASFSSRPRTTTRRTRRSASTVRSRSSTTAPTGRGSSARSAAGLLAFAVFSLVEARFRRI